MKVIRSLGCVWSVAIIGLCVSTPTSARADAVELKETLDDTLFNVTVSTQVSGQLHVPSGQKAPLSMKLKVDAQHSFTERRLSGAGRDAQALRGLRDYRTAKAEILVGEQPTVSTLRNEVRTVVAHGQREGVQFYSLRGPLTYAEIDLLRTPGDPLVLLTLLPEKTVEIGETWRPSDWVLQFMTGLEAVEKTELSCKFESIKGTLATIAVTGKISGAAVGAASEVQVTGTVQFDTSTKRIRAATFEQTEKRSIGSVSPGLEVVAKVAITRTQESGTNPFSAAEIQAIPLEPAAGQLLLGLDLPQWGTRLYHERNWHLWHRTAKVAVFRLMDRGNLIAQCNLSAIPRASAGQHMAEADFLKDLQKTLGSQLQKIVSAEKIEGQENRFVYRVVALGETPQGPVMWSYYLVAAPDGRQMVYVFVVEPKLHEQLKGRDLSLVSGLEFVPERTPQAAGK